MKLLTLIMMAILFAGCATPSYQTEKILKGKNAFPKKAFIKNVPFYQQKKNHCGPAALGMVLGYKGQKADLQKLTLQMMTPLKEGTYQTDLISTTRRQGMLPIAVMNMTSLLTELSRGNPVIVFQNLALKSAPKWHYAVVTGYNLKKPEIILHSGKDKNLRMNMRIFEHYWTQADFWGLVVLKPGEISPTADDISHVNATAGLEQLSKLKEAEVSYKAILERWPDSLAAHIGLGNIKYMEGKFTEAVIYLKAATIKHPHSPIAWHNLATAQGASKMRKEAIESSEKALSLADQTLRPQFSESLKNFIQK